MIKKLLLSLLLFFYITPVLSQTAFFNYKTEKVVIEEGIILERKIKSSDGSLISEEYKILINGNYYSAELNNGKWELSKKGKEQLEKSQEKKDMSSSAGGGCGG